MTLETSSHARQTESNTLTLRGLEEHRFAAGALLQCHDDDSSFMAEYLLRAMSAHGTANEEALTTTFRDQHAERAFFDISCGLLALVCAPSIFGPERLALMPEHLLAVDALMANLRNQHDTFIPSG